MNGAALDSVLLEGLKALFIVGVPLLASLSLASLLVGVIQGAMAIQDSATAYAVRVLALVATLYVLFPLFSRTLLSLTELAFR